MIHYMRLNDKTFQLIKDHKKTIELRLNDEKRQKIKINDFIIFENITTKDVIKVEVINIYKYESFEELYKYFSKTSLGYLESEEKDFNDMYYYYSKSDIEKYGVMGIEIFFKE